MSISKLGGRDRLGARSDVRMESRAGPTTSTQPRKLRRSSKLKYCEQECRECEVPAAELDETTAQLCPPTPARKLDVGSMVQLNSAGLVVESDYDWSADPLAPGVHGTITGFNFYTGYAYVESTDSSRGAANYCLSNLEPARDVAARVLTSIMDAVCSNFGERDLAQGTFVKTDSAVRADTEFLFVPDTVD